MYIHIYIYTFWSILAVSNPSPNTSSGWAKKRRKNWKKNTWNHQPKSSQTSGAGIISPFMEWAFPRQHILKNSTPPTFPYSRTVVPNPAATSSSIRDFEIIFIYFGLHVRFRVRIAYYAEFKTTYIYINTNIILYIYNLWICCCNANIWDFYTEYQYIWYISTMFIFTILLYIWWVYKISIQNGVPLPASVHWSHWSMTWPLLGGFSHVPRKSIAFP